MNPAGNRAPLVVLAVAILAGLAGLGLLVGSLVLNANQRQSAVRAITTPSGSSPTASSSPSPAATPTSAPSAAPTWTPPVQPSAEVFPPPDSSYWKTPPACNYGDFPVYPGSDKGNPDPPTDLAWISVQSADTVASYFIRGAYQQAWTFHLMSQSFDSFTLRYTRAPACRGTLRIVIYGSNGQHQPPYESYYQVSTDAP